MKKIVRLFAAGAISLMGLNSYAQVDGTTNIAANFQEYDTDEVLHDLYADYLDNNIPVVIDIMAHWCPPCWSYSNQNPAPLETVWEEHGLSATGDSTVMVFMADGDAGSTFDLLNGIGSGTEGDWMSITNYPVFGGETGLGAGAGRDLANLYEITYFPTIYLIHPDRTIEEIGQLGAAGVMSAVNNANMLSTLTSDLNLMHSYNMNSACDGGELTFDYIMKNSTGNVMTSATLDVEIDGVVTETINWSGNLAGYDLSEETMTTTVTGIAGGDHTLELIVKTVNGAADEDASNNTITKEFTVKETARRYYKLKVQTDGAGNETNWNIKDGSGSVVFKRSDFNNGPYDNNTLYEHDIDLREATCYKLTVTDSDGDGMSGYVNLKDEEGVTMAHVIVTETSKDGAWQSTVVSSMSELNNGYVAVHPNPVKNVLNIDLSAGNAVNVSYDMVNILGQSVESKDLGVLRGTNNLSINTENLSEGVYILTVQMGNEKITERIVK